MSGRRNVIRVPGICVRAKFVNLVTLDTPAIKFPGDFRVLKIFFLTIFLLIPAAHSQELSKLIGSDHFLYGRYSYLTGPFREDAAGNIYAVQSGQSHGVVRVYPDGFANIVFSAWLPLGEAQISILNPDPTKRSDNHDGTSTGVRFGNVTDFDIGEDGSVYAVADNVVVKVATDGTVRELINGSGDDAGHSLSGPSIVSINQHGEVLVAGAGSNNVFMIDALGNIEQVLDEVGVDGKQFAQPTEIISDKFGNRYIASRDAVFKIGISGVISPYLMQEFNPEWPAGEALQPRNLAIDDFGNLYFTRENDINSLYRVTSSGVVARMLDETGDGTGEVICRASVDSIATDEQWPCDHFGNSLHSISNVSIDAAQNVFVVGQVSRNVFKLTPSGQVSEVADLGAYSEFDKMWFRSNNIDSSGNLYFTVYEAMSSTKTSIYRFSPLPFERSEAFTIDTPHANVVHDVTGIGFLPVHYSRTEFRQQGEVPAVAAALDTRSLPLASLPWESAEVTTETIPSFNIVNETRIATLQAQGHSFRREELSKSVVPLGVRNVKRLTYFVDGVETIRLFNLWLPRSDYLALEGEALARWVYRNDDVIYGGPQADTLYAYDGHDILYGGAGDDILNGGNGGNLYYGGSGTDTVEYEHRYADYILSRNPTTLVVSIREKTGLGNPFVDQIGPDVEQISFQDASIDVRNIRYWGGVLATELTSVDDRNAAPVYRFFNSLSNAFFYTNNREERTGVLRNSGLENRAKLDWPFNYQGAKFQTAHTYPGAVPLYRFYNTLTGHHFFTINEGERDNVLENISSKGWPFVFEGVAFSVYASDPTPNEQGMERAMYRYYSTTLNRHAFTTSELEAQSFDASQDWTYEGIGFYVEGLQ